jgi:predicted peroxiredoxin
MKISKLIVLLLIIVLGTTLAQTKSTSKTKTKTPEVQQQVPPPPPPKDGVVIHISSGLESPAKVMAGLTMALKFSESKDVIVFFDVNGPEVVLTNSKSIEYKKYEPSKMVVMKLLDKGIPVTVCQMCLEAMNKTQYDLMKGIKLSNKNDFFDFTQGRILTLDF